MTDLNEMVEVVKMEARAALAQVRDQVVRAEGIRDEARKNRIATVVAAAQVLDIPEIAELLGVSESSVSTWLRSAPELPKIEIVDGRTGEVILDGPRSEIAEMPPTRSYDSLAE